MNPEKMYDIFTEALCDDTVKAELIRKITEKAGRDRIEGQTELFPQNDASALTAENAELSRQIALLELELGRLSGENKDLTQKVRQGRDSLNFYTVSYGAQIALYEKYKTLSQPVMKIMKQIFKNDSLNGIFLCGVQIDNLKSLRDYTEQLIKNGPEGREKDIAVLNELYVYLLSCYNSTYSKPVYRLTDARAGDSFSEELHYNTGTARSGSVSRVLMQGCAAAGSGRIIRKAIVELF
ncbi:MAG: hypothetical protein NC120_02335 [Ruminococcus sp.]|nr:hypothetical protein [Ruminococcus sp.]